MTVTDRQLRDEVGRIRRVAADVRAPAGIAVVLPVVCLAAGLVAAGVGIAAEPAAMWGALLANWLFWTGLAAGGVVFAAALRLCDARWGRVVERLAAAQAAFLPVSLVLLVPMWFGRARLFPWLALPLRSGWLNVGWLFARDALAVLVVLLLGAGLRRRMVRGGNARPFAAGLCVAWFGCFGVLAVDLVMRLDPGYHSTVYPLVYLAGSFYAALAAAAVTAARLRARAGAAREVLAPHYLLNLGNLVWGFVLFVGYLWWCEYLVFWMGDLPLEAGRHLSRWRADGWPGLAWAALACAVFVPGALLLSRAAKRSGVALGAIAAIGAVGVLLERLLDVLPSVGARVSVGSALVAAGVSVGFAGAFGLCRGAALRRASIFPVEDPVFTEALAVRDVAA